MRALYIDHYAGLPTPGMRHRPHAMAAEWTGMGAEIALLVGTHSHLRKKNLLDTKPLEPVEIGGAEFRSVYSHAHNGNGIGRVLSMADSVDRSWLAAGRIAREVRPDAAIASSTYSFNAYLAQRVAKAPETLLVYEIHDLWSLTPIELDGYSSKYPLMWTMARTEKSVYHNGDTVVSVLPSAEPHVRPLRIVTPVIPVPNGIESDAPHEPAPEAFTSQIEDLHERGCAVIGYAGGMTNANAMDDLVSATALVRDEPVIALLLGSGLYQTNLEKQARDSGVRVISMGSIPKSQVHEALKLCDALYIGSETSPLYTFGVSANEISGYMATGVPIINTFASEHLLMVYAGSTIRACGGDLADVARAIREVVSLPAEERARLGELSVAQMCKHHATPVLARQSLDVLGGRF